MILVLIADDEPLECEALEKMIYNRFPQVQVLPSVYDGLMLVDAVAREHPDIVIIDINMPGLNGLEALERLNMMRVQMEVIIHTAYSQFDYIHKALKMGASDFLVKPVFEEDFAEAFSSVLQTAEEKKSLSEEKNSDLAVSKAINSVLENSVMMSLLLHKPDENSWDLLWNGTDRKQEGAGLIAAFRFRFRKPDESAYDILVKAVRKYCNCLSMIHQNVCYCYLLANALMEAGTFQEWIKSWLPGLLNSMEDRFEAEAKVGISSFQDSYFDMYKAVDEADIALQNEITGRITFYECESRTVAENIFSGKPTFLSQYLKEGKTEQALERLGQILRENGCVQKVDFATCFYTVELLVNTALLLDIDKRRVGMRWTMQECLRKLYEENIWPKASMADAHVSFTQFETWLHRMLDELQEDLKRPIRKSNLYVEKALIYVERNYMRDISLESVADSIGITQFYLSRLFKQERNQTFLEALTDIRISRSIRLLLDPTRSVSNVSMMTGYNLKYFYQVFKNATGMSQRKFREGMFRIEE